MRLSLAACDEYTLLSEFCGVGGDSYGATRIPGVRLRLGANHNKQAIESHSANFPYADHYLGDVRSIDMAKFPRCDIAWFSPSCPPFSSARGVRRDFDRDTQGTLWEDEEDAEIKNDARRGRTLMFEVIHYLEAMELRHTRPVYAFVTENVPEARKWDAWPSWIGRLNLQYHTRVIALNSMHAQSPRSPRAPQSRDRLYVAGVHKSVGRVPDWDKWLRPRAYCPACDETVNAMQVFKQPGLDMGRYGRNGQYWYRCPRITCRNAIVEPEYMAAYEIIDWTDPGTAIEDRKRPMSPKTLARIEAGLRKHVIPITAEVAGNTFERTPGARTWPVTSPVTTQTTSETKALCVPPMLVPASGTWHDEAAAVDQPFRTRTTREYEGLAVPPFITVLRSGRPRSFDPATSPTATMTAGAVRPAHHAGGPGQSWFDLG